MREQIINLDFSDFIALCDDFDTCRICKLKLTKEEFLSAEYLKRDSMPTSKCLLFFVMPKDNEVTMDELSELLNKLQTYTASEEVLWGCATDDTIIHIELFLVKLN